MFGLLVAAVSTYCNRSNSQYHSIFSSLRTVDHTDGSIYVLSTITTLSLIAFPKFTLPAIHQIYSTGWLMNFNILPVEVTPRIHVHVQY